MAKQTPSAGLVFLAVDLSGGFGSDPVELLVHADLTAAERRDVVVLVFGSLAGVGHLVQFAMTRRAVVTGPVTLSRTRSTLAPQPDGGAGWSLPGQKYQ